MAERFRLGRLLYDLAFGAPAGEEPAAPPVPPGMRLAPPRAIPVPATVSPEMQQAIAAPVEWTTVSRTDGEWQERRREADAKALAEARAAARSLGVTVAPTTIGGVNAHLVTPSLVAPENAGRLLVHLHGGAYVYGGGEAGTCEAIIAAHFGRAPVLSVDYRMPPEHPFPAAVDDAVAVWSEVLKTHDPARVALFGTSAGGGLTMASVLRLKELWLPLPGVLFLGTPWTDLSKTGDTYFINEGIDNVLPTYDGPLEAAAMSYAAGHPLTDPLISPVYGDLSGFPPTVLISGTRDLLLSCTIRAHRRLREAGVEAELHVYEGQSHAQYGKAFPAPESLDAIGEVARFFDRHLKR